MSLNIGILYDILLTQQRYTQRRIATESGVGAWHRTNQWEAVINLRSFYPELVMDHVQVISDYITQDLLAS